MDDNTSKTEPQEAKSANEPTAQPARRPWVKPIFERESLKEALAKVPGAIDGTGYS